MDVKRLVEGSTRQRRERREEPVRQGGHVAALDGVRGVAILLVLVAHFAEAFGGDGAPLRLLRSGWCGVDLFFVLSGFLITGILWDTKGQPGYFRNFYARRSLRIFPLYYATLAFALWIAPIFGPGGIRRAVGADAPYFWFYGVNILAARRVASFPLIHLWSLAVEEHFYLVWPFVVSAFGRRTLLRICLGLSVLALALRAWLASRYGPHAAFYLTPCRMDSLAIGACCALWIRGTEHLRMVRPAAAGAAIAAGVALLAAGVAWRGLPMLDAEFLVWGPTLLAVFSAGIILLVAGPRPVAPIDRLFRWRFLRVCGMYSYGAYMLHPFLMEIMQRRVTVGRLTAGLGSPAIAGLLYLALGVGGSLALAALSWHLYERQFLELKRYFAYRR